MRYENVVWAYNDMDAARRLWPRVKALIEKQVEHGELELSLGDQRRVIAAVVNDLLEQEKQSQFKQIGRMARLFRRTTTQIPHQQSA